MDTSSPRLRTLVTDAFLVALGTAFLYLMAYFYERGYCDHFDIPQNLINTNTTTVLVAAAAIGTFVFLSMQLFGLAVPLFRAGINPSQPLKPYRQLFLLNAMLLLFGMVLFRAYGFGWVGALLFFALVVFLNFIFFGIGIFIHRNKGTMAERFEAIQDDSKEDAFDAWVLIQEKIGRSGVLGVISIICFLGIAYVVGNGEASRQHRFLMLSQYQNYVALRVYGDRVIAGKLNVTTNEIGPELMLLIMKDSEPLIFEAKLLGPLKSAPLIEPEQPAVPAMTHQNPAALTPQGSSSRENPTSHSSVTPTDKPPATP